MRLVGISYGIGGELPAHDHDFDIECYEEDKIFYFAVFEEFNIDHIFTKERWFMDC